MSGTRVFMYFFAFFITVAAVNALFVYTALNTNTGLVTEKPYEKGIAFNDVLAKVKAQPAWSSTFDLSPDGIATLSLKDDQGVPLEHAKIEATFVRPVQDGHDVKINMDDLGGGNYQTQVKLPYSGYWIVKVSATWNNMHFQESRELVLR